MGFGQGECRFRPVPFDVLDVRIWILKIKNYFTKNPEMQEKVEKKNEI